MGKRSPVRDVDAKLNRARADHGAGRLAAASRVYDRILLDAPDRADVLHLRAIIARQTGDSALAITLLRRATSIRPESPAILYSLGLALSEDCRFREAGVAYGRVLKRDGRFPGALTSLALARYGEGNTDEARERLKRAIELDPDDVRALASLGCLAFEDGDYEAVRRYLTRAARLEDAYAFGAACHMGDAFFAHADPGRLKSLIGALPEIAGDFPTGPGEGPVIATCCDQQDYARFARRLIESVDRNAPGFRVHLHLVNPEPETADDVDRLAGELGDTGLSVTTERARGADRAYILKIRFARLLQLHAACDADLFSLDADSLILAGLDTLADAAGTGDIAVPLRPHLAELNQKVFAAAVLARPTQGARRLLEHLAAYILSVSEDGAPPRQLDQCAFYIASRMLAGSGPPVALTPLPRRFADNGFDDASSVWTAGAGRAFPCTLADYLPERT